MSASMAALAGGRRSKKFHRPRPRLWTNGLKLTFARRSSRWLRLKSPTRPSSESEPLAGEGRPEDFQALLNNCSLDESEADDQDVPLLPAEGDVKLQARTGAVIGAEFKGKSTLAGAGGIYCLIQRFDLPVGTGVKLTLTGPQGKAFEVADAVVKRVRKAPGESAEVQLGFDAPNEDFEDFVANHFGAKPGRFSLFGRWR